MDKITKKLIRIWILITSIAIFIVGWITVAHARIIPFTEEPGK